MDYSACELARLKYENAIMAEEIACMRAILDRVACLTMHMGRAAAAQRAHAQEMATILTGIDSAGNLIT